MFWQIYRQTLRNWYAFNYRQNIIYNNYFTPNFIHQEFEDKCKNYCTNNATCIVRDYYIKDNILSLLNITNVVFLQLEKNQPKCICNSAYFGAKCEKSLTKLCENKICVNGGSCRLSETTQLPECVCAKGYLGESCEIKNLCKRPDRIACYNNGTCLLDRDNSEFCKIRTYYSSDNYLSINNFICVFRRM